MKKMKIVFRGSMIKDLTLIILGAITFATPIFFGKTIKIKKK